MLVVVGMRCPLRPLVWFDPNSIVCASAGHQQLGQHPAADPAAVRPDRERPVWEAAVLRGTDRKLQGRSAAALTVVMHGHKRVIC